MSFPVRALITSSCVSVTLLLVSGCGIGTIISNSGPVTAMTHITGGVHGGQQPVSGSSIQLYAANLTTFQGPSTAMLSTAVTSDANGDFDITGLYTCPSGDAMVYLVATGGNPGLTSGTNNTGIAMMSLLGRCSDVLAAGESMSVWVDEITTVVAVNAMAPFMTDYAHIGSAPSTVNGVAGALETASSEINFSTGNFGVADSYIDLPIDTFNTISDILAACINTAGGAGPCSTLFSTTGASDTIGAALQITKNPGDNTQTLYNLITSNAPFQPYFTTVPTDFTATTGFTLPAFVQAGALDSNGHVWIYYGGYTYTPGTDTSTDSPGYITVYDNNFNSLFTISPGTGGLYYPDTLTSDANGNVFAINANNTISEFNSSGGAVSPAGGWPTGVTTTFSPTGSGNGYVNSSNQAGPILADALGNIWGGVGNSSFTGNCYFELNSSGANITPTTGTFCTTEGLYDVDKAAVDGLGNAWALSYLSISQVNAMGNLSATAATSQGCFYPDSLYTSATEDYITTNILYDRANNQLWGYSYLGAGAVTDAGVSVFCDSGPTTLPVIAQYSSTSTTPGAPYSAGNLLIDNAVLDGNGNFWFVTGGVAATGVVGSSSGTFTGTASFASWLGEISPSGSLQTPYNTTSQVYGLQPTGFGAQTTATGTNARVLLPAAPSVTLLGVDKFGNIWATDSESYKILKITGLAAANSVNYQ
jgi:hypothetical protein